MLAATECFRRHSCGMPEVKFAVCVSRLCNLPSTAKCIGHLAGIMEVVNSVSTKFHRMSMNFKTPFLERTKYDQAAWMLDLAMRGKFIVARPGTTGLPQEVEAINVYAQFLYLSKFYKYAVFTLLTLTIFETPLWCNGEGHVWIFARAHVVCQIPESKSQAILSGVPLIPTAWGIMIEVVCYAICLWKLHTELRLEEFFKKIGEPYRNYLRRLEALVLVVLGILDVGFFVFNLNTTFRIAPYVRFLLGATVPSIRKICRTFLRTGWEIRITFTLLCGTILVFAWIAALLLGDTDLEDKYGNGLADSFQTFGYALYTSFCTVTTTNLPDDLVPTFSVWSGYLVLWLPILLLGAVIFMNVILAVVYNSYQDQIKHRLKKFYFAREKGVDNTFNLIAEQKGDDMVVTYETFDHLTQSLVKLGIPVDTNLLQYVFKALDDDQSGALGKEEFGEMCDVLQYKFKLTVRDSLWQANPIGKKLKSICDNGEGRVEEGGVKYELGYQDTFSGSLFDKIMSCILGANVCFIVVESYYDLNNIQEPRFFNYLDFFFSFVYLGEVCVKLMVWSWSEYWSDADNRFDFTTSLLLAAVGSYLLVQDIASGGAAETGEVLTYLNMLRLVRIVKALEDIPAVRREFDTMSKMLQACSDVLLINGLVIYLWSAAGLQLFGGELYIENPKLSWNYDIDDDDSWPDYFGSHCEVYNFNDVPLGMITLFYFCIVGWVPEVAEIVIMLAGEGKTARNGPKIVIYTFLLSFYIASILIAFNVFTAFSIDIFNTIKDQMDKEEEMREKGKAGDEGSIEENLNKIKTTIAKEGKCLHIGQNAQQQQAQVYKEFLLGDDDDEAAAKEGEAIEPKQIRYGVQGDLDQD